MCRFLLLFSYSFYVSLVVRKLLYNFWLVVSIFDCLVNFGVSLNVCCFDGWFYRNIFSIRNYRCSRVMMVMMMEVVRGMWVLEGV